MPTADCPASIESIRVVDAAALEALAAHTHRTRLRVLRQLLPLNHQHHYPARRWWETRIPAFQLLLETMSDMGLEQAQALFIGTWHVFAAIDAALLLCEFQLFTPMRGGSTDRKLRIWVFAQLLAHLGDPLD